MRVAGTDFDPLNSANTEPTGDGKFETCARSHLWLAWPGTPNLRLMPPDADIPTASMAETSRERDSHDRSHRRRAPL